MANCNNKTATFLNMMILLLSLLLMISITDCTALLGIGFGKGAPETTPECKSVYGAQGGETCSAIIQKFTLSADFFSAINPNLNCDNIFVGQWLCINGTCWYSFRYGDVLPCDSFPTLMPKSVQTNFLKNINNF